MGTNRQAEASRENGKKSKGPTSTIGKARAQQNTLKSGIFSQALVITAAGETQQDFDRFRNAVWAHFDPQDVVNAMLVDQFVSASWRLQRTRRYEMAEIRKRLDAAGLRKHFDDIAAADLMKAKFLRYHSGRGNYMPGEIPDDYSRSLDETRRELLRNSAGLEFLTWLLESIVQTVRLHGYIPRPDDLLLVDILGMGDQTLLNCMKLNELLRDKMRKQHMQQTEGAAAGPTANEDDRNNRIEMQNMLLSMIKKKNDF